MSYLYLNFKQGKLHQSLTKFNTLDKKADDNANTDIIIGIEQVSNVLHILLGLPPCPSKRDSRFSHNKEIFAVAQTAKIKYDNYLGVDDWGIFNGIEFGLAFKEAYNSHQKLNTNFIINNKETLVIGFWNWNTLKKYMYNKRTRSYHQWDVFYNFLCEFLNEEDLINKISLYNLIKKISDNNYEKIYPYINKLKNDNIFNGCSYVYSLFSGNDLNKIDSNTTYSSQQPMIYNNGMRYYKSFSGQIVIEIPDYFKDIINENEGFCTILDGGFVSIYMSNIGVGEYDGYEKIH